MGSTAQGSRLRVPDKLPFSAPANRGEKSWFPGHRTGLQLNSDGGLKMDQVNEQVMKVAAEDSVVVVLSLEDLGQVGGGSLGAILL
jgi:hypothetical protein